MNIQYIQSFTFRRNTHTHYIIRASNELIYSQIVNLCTGNNLEINHKEDKISSLPFLKIVQFHDSSHHKLTFYFNFLYGKIYSFHFKSHLFIIFSLYHRIPNFQCFVGPFRVVKTNVQPFPAVAHALSLF